MKVIKIILTIQSLIIISVLFYLTQKAFRVEGDLKLLKTQVSSLEEEINSVGSQADDLDGEVSSIKSKVDDIGVSISGEDKFNYLKDIDYETDERGRIKLYSDEEMKEFEASR